LRQFFRQRESCRFVADKPGEFGSAGFLIFESGEEPITLHLFFQLEHHQLLLGESSGGIALFGGDRQLAKQGNVVADNCRGAQLQPQFQPGQAEITENSALGDLAAVPFNLGQPLEFRFFEIEDFQTGDLLAKADHQLVHIKVILVAQGECGVGKLGGTARLFLQAQRSLFADLAGKIAGYGEAFSLVQVKRLGGEKGGGEKEGEEQDRCRE
jgi:hypothetical protein